MNNPGLWTAAKDFCLTAVVIAVAGGLYAVHASEPEQDVATPIVAHADDAQQPNAEWFSPGHSTMGDASYVCNREDNPAVFARTQRLLHTVDIQDVTDPTTGKAVQSTLVISDIRDPVILYRGLERCEAALPPLEAAERARRAARQQADAKYQ